MRPAIPALADSPVVNGTWRSVNELAINPISNRRAYRSAIPGLSGKLCVAASVRQFVKLDTSAEGFIPE